MLPRKWELISYGHKSSSTRFPRWENSTEKGLLPLLSIFEMVAITIRHFLVSFCRFFFVPQIYTIINALVLRTRMIRKRCTYDVYMVLHTRTIRVRVLQTFTIRIRAADYFCCTPIHFVWRDNMRKMIKPQSVTIACGLTPVVFWAV